MIQSHERNIKPFKSGWRNSGVAISDQSDLPAFSWKVILKNSYKFQAYDKSESYVPGRKLLYWYLANWFSVTPDHCNWCSGAWPVPACRESGFGQSSGIWPFLESRLPELGHSRQVIFRKCWGWAWFFNWLAGDWKMPEIYFDWTLTRPSRNP